LEAIPRGRKENKLYPWVLVLKVYETLKDLKDLLGTLNLSLSRIVTANDPDGANDLASEVEIGGGRELGDAALRFRDGTTNGEAPPALADSDRSALRK
jgi:hypothetical protein